MISFDKFKDGRFKNLFHLDIKFISIRLARLFLVARKKQYSNNKDFRAEINEM